MSIWLISNLRHFFSLLLFFYYLNSRPIIDRLWQVYLQLNNSWKFHSHKKLSRSRSQDQKLYMKVQAIFLILNNREENVHSLLTQMMNPQIPKICFSAAQPNSACHGLCPIFESRFHIFRMIA